MILKKIRIAIVGASLGGLSAANVLHRLGAKVSVFEAYANSFHGRGDDLGPLDEDLIQAILGETNKPDEQREQAVKGHRYFYGNLWQQLFNELPLGMVCFGNNVGNILEPNSLQPKLLVDGIEHSFDLIIGADGRRSSIRRFVTKQLPKYAGYTLWRGLVSQRNISGSPSGSRTIAGVRYETSGYPFIGAGNEAMWSCGVYLAMPETEVKSVPDWFVPFIRVLFGDRNATFWSDCILHGKVVQDPVWEFAAERVVNGRIVLLGDAANMVSPKIGAGAYTAMVDAVILEESLKNASSIDEALERYNDNTVPRGSQLLQRSRQVAANFSPKGKKILSPELLLNNLS